MPAEPRPEKRIKAEPVGKSAYMNVEILHSKKKVQMHSYVSKGMT